MNQLSKATLADNLQNLEKSLFFLTILFLPTQLGKHFWPPSSSIFSLRIDYLSPTIYFWDLLMLLLISAFLTRSWLQKKWLLNNTFLQIYVFFLLTQILSLVNSTNIEASFVRLKDYLVTGLLGIYVSSISFTQIRKFFSPALVISVIFTCLLAIFQFLSGKTLGLWIVGERSFDLSTPLIARFNFYEHVFLRPYATFPHPNLLAAYLVLALPLVAFFLSKKYRSLILINFLLSALTIFITFSRPALLLIGLQLIIHFRRLWKIQLILLALTFPLIFVRLSSIFTYDSLSILRRRELSEYALKLFTENPLFGVGLNNFLNVLAIEHILIGTNRFLQPVHNIFLFIASETGLMGLLGFLVLLAASISRCIKSTVPFYKILLGNLFMIIFLGFFDHYFLSLPQGQRMLFMLVGLCFTKSRKTNNSSNTPVLTK